MQKKTIREKLKEHNWAIKEWAVADNVLLYSEAFSKLSGTSIRVLLRFLQKRSFHKEGKGRNRRTVYDNKPIIFTYSEAECFNIPRSSFARAIRDLIEMGFIEIEHQGGSIGNGRDWSTYRLIDDWKEYGNDIFIPRVKKPVIQYSKSIKRHNEKLRKQNTRSKPCFSPRNDTRTVPEMIPEA